MSSVYLILVAVMTIGGSLFFITTLDGPMIDSIVPALITSSGVIVMALGTIIHHLEKITAGEHVHRHEARPGDAAPYRGQMD